VSLPLNKLSASNYYTGVDSLKQSYQPLIKSWLHLALQKKQWHTKYGELNCISS